MINFPEYSPLYWLTAQTFSILFHDYFTPHQQREHGNYSNISLDEEVTKRIFSYLRSDQTRQSFFNDALGAVESGHIEKYELVSQAGQGDHIIVNSLSFCNWVEGNKNSSLYENFSFLTDYARLHYQEAAYFPKAQPQELKEYLEQPILNVGDSIIYLLGRKCFLSNEVFWFLEKNDAAQEIISLIRRDFYSGSLKLHGYDGTSQNIEDLYRAQIFPKDLLHRAATWKSVQLSVLKQNIFDKEIDTRERNTLLKLIAVLFDIIEPGIDKPYASAEYIFEEAKKRGIEISTETIGQKIKRSKEYITIPPKVKISPTNYKKTKPGSN